MGLLWAFYMRSRFAGPKVSHKEHIFGYCLTRDAFLNFQEEEILAIVARARDRSSVAFALDDVST